jgi:hypothetical protein
MTNRRRQYDAAMKQVPYTLLSDEALDEFIAIYKEEYGEDIDRKDALSMATELVTLYLRLSRKLPNEHISPATPMQRADDSSSTDYPQIGFRT